MSSLAAWMLVLAAGLLEVGMAIALKTSQGWTQPLSIARLLCMTLIFAGIAGLRTF